MENTLPGETHRSNEKDQQIASEPLTKEMEDKFLDELELPTCNICDQTFSSKYYCSKHMMSHTEKKRFPCDQCEKSFYSKIQLNDHLLAHQGVRPYNCELCQKSFTQRSALKAHILRIHRVADTSDNSKTRQYECNVCGKVFPKLTFAENHYKVHSNERPFKCDECEKCFKTKTQLVVHKRTHNGVRPYGCRYCLKSFNQLGARSRHEEKMHPVRNSANAIMEQKNDDPMMPQALDKEISINFSSDIFLDGEFSDFP